MNSSSYERKAQPIREVVQNPDPQFMADRLSKTTEGLHSIIPNVAEGMKLMASRALQYLHSKMPKAGSEMVGDEEFQPSKSQQRSWLNLHHLVSNPISALSHVRHGTLTSDHMDALQNVHPELLEEMKQKVMEEMDPKKVKSLPSSTKRSLGLFLGTPVSSSGLPEAIRMNQNVYQLRAAASSIQPKSTVGGLKELKLGQRAATETESLEEEKA